MVDRIRLAQALAAIVSDGPAPEDWPARLCRECVTALPVDGVGLSLMTSEPGGRMLLGATDEVGFQIEELQFSLGEGPCVTAFSQARPVLVPDVTTREARAQWPVFADEVAALDVRGLFAFPLQVGAIGIGVLDCHRRRAGELAELADALAVATAVTTVLLDYQLRALSPGQTRPELADVSWRDHAAVHQATGMLASQLELPTAAALARLRAYAFRQGRPVHEVAVEVLARRVRVPHEDDTL